MQMPRILQPPPPVVPVKSGYEYYVKHFVLEAMASVLVTYSAFCVPSSQYMGSICVFAIIMTLKDSDYFFPDSTPVATAVLWAATLYTSENGSTNWLDIFSRVLGQLSGFVLVFWLLLMEPVDSEAETPTIIVGAVNEGIGTMIEGVAIAFATIPLLSPYDLSDGLQSKSEAVPPSNGSLILVALSLAFVHYTLERLFRASMNPLVTILRCYLENRGCILVVSCQLLGLLAAIQYVCWCLPSRETLRKLRKGT